MNHHFRWFDRYRDSELNPAQKREFEAHLAVCDDCGGRVQLLNRLVLVLGREDVGSPATPANIIASRVSEKPPSWDDVLVSWLRPAQVWSAVALLLILFSFIGTAPATHQTVSSGECEVLMSQSGQADSVWGLSGSLTDDELERWLGQRGNTQRTIPERL